MKDVLLTWILTLFVVLVASAQNPILDQPVSFSYDKVRLGDALSDISQVYQVRFAYSRNVIPVGQEVSAQTSQIPLSEALDLLLKETKVIFATIGNQVVLKLDPDKPISLEKNGGIFDKSTSSRELDEESMMAAEEFIFVPTHRKPWLNLPPIEQEAINEVSPKFRSSLERADDDLPDQIDFYNRTDKSRMAQMSIFPYLGTNHYRSDDYTNTVSLNVFWGHNGGVNGVEVGGMFNTVRTGVNGFQLAGVGNVVNGDIVGTQMAGLFNIGKNRITGVQTAGLFNISHGRSVAIQSAGLMNVVGSDMIGVQVAGLFNIGRGDVSGTQVAGLFNRTGGEVNGQFSGLVNIAETVTHGQISGFINIAKEVDGFQLGIININDTINGTSIGLINFVKSGYNRFELSGSDFMHARMGVKLGTKSFYNIFQVGMHFSNKPLLNTGKCYSWGLGYGIGHAWTLGERSLLNIELMSMHINECEVWTNELNLLNQLSLTYDYGLTPQLSLFIGPTFNLLASRRQRAKGSEVPGVVQLGSELVPYTIWEDHIDANNAQWQTWIGIHGGIRF
ncbi:MAG: hypothetical protein AAFP19_09640 [Bacteroidota bacterium]